VGGVIELIGQGVI